MPHRFSPLLLPALLCGLVLAFILDLSSGSYPLKLANVLAGWSRRDTVDALVLLDIRLPRALLATLVGICLGLAGAAMQGLLRNPLAGPGLVGVSNCAALGAVIMFYFGFAGMAWYLLPLGGLLGAGLCVVLIFFLAGQQASVLGLILAGVAINAVASSLISLALNFSQNPYAMSEIVYWLLGSVADRSMADVAIALPFMVLGWLCLGGTGRFLNALSFGEESAQSMGFDIRRQRALIIVGVALTVGAAVSVSGNVGFVGLVVPHLIRPLVGAEPGRLLLPSALAGGLLVLLADVAVQLLSPQQELKLGVITALVGGPFFLWLVYRMRHDVV
jgi:iron complex transport system permease protein